MDRETDLTDIAQRFKALMHASNDLPLAPAEQVLTGELALLRSKYQAELDPTEWNRADHMAGQFLADVDPHGLQQVKAQIGTTAAFEGAVAIAKAREGAAPLGRDRKLDALRAYGEIRKRHNDPEFMERHHGGGQIELAEMTALFARAYGE